MIQDLTGQRFGRLIVLETFRENNKTFCKCKCDCGNEKIIRSNNLKRGKTKSCGCLHKEKTQKINYKHGYWNTRLYNIWCGMKSRCYNKNNIKYKIYGARGIKICDEWLNNFVAFHNWAITNGYDEKALRGECTIDRIDVNGNYEPSNCRWITNKEQANNTRKNHFVTFNNETHTLKEWSEILNINYGTLRSRIITYKWDYIKSITTPIKKRK